MGCRRWLSPNSPGPWPRPGAVPPAPAKALAEARQEQRREDPAPSPPATHFPIHSDIPGQHRDTHILIATFPQPNLIPCRDANPPRGTRTRDPEPRGSHCTPSWPRTPGLSLGVGVACHMWLCPGWPWLSLPKAMSPESSTQVRELPTTVSTCFGKAGLRHGVKPSSPRGKKGSEGGKPDPASEIARGKRCLCRAPSKGGSGAARGEWALQKARMLQTPVHVQPVSSSAGACWHLGPARIFLPSAPRTDATAHPPPPSLWQHPAGQVGGGQGPDYKHLRPRQVSMLFKSSRAGCLQDPSTKQPSTILLPMLGSCPGTSTRHSLFPGQVFASEHPRSFPN